MSKKCLLCGSLSSFSLDRYSKDYLYKCVQCGFVFCNKTPTELELQEFYKDYAYAEVVDSPITKKRYLGLLDGFEAYRKNNRILDVGCGSGYFLEVAKERNWEVYGSEYSEKAIQILQSKDIYTHQGELHKDAFDVGSFDIITSFEVLEHLVEPKREIELMSLFLRQGGLLYITTPNFNALSRNVLKEKWSIIHYPEHLNYFTYKTLHKLLTKSGLKKKKIKTTGFSVQRFKMRNSNTKNAENKDEKIRQQMNKKGLVHYAVRFINFCLNLCRKGDTIKAWYTKT